MEQKQKFPTEIVDLPSEGKLYPKDSPLANGTIEMKYMTAKEEDILTNQNYIEKGIVIDKLIKALIVDKTIDYNEILLGDKNALLVAARILGYGKDYEFTYGNEKQNVDLSLLNNRPLNKEVSKATSNSFNFTLPTTKRVITFKILTHGDEVKIDQEIRGLKKINKESSAEMSTRAFVDNEFLARDSRAFRNYLRDFQPDVDMRFYPETGPEGGVDIPIGVNFLWPDAAI